MAIIRTYITVDEDQLFEFWQKDRKDFFFILYPSLLQELLPLLNGRKVPEEVIEKRTRELVNKGMIVKDKDLSKKLAKILGLNVK